MDNSYQKPPIELVHMLPKLNTKFIELIKGLTFEEWHAQTIAKRWKVKDVVAHLLDGNIRILSMLRDGYYAEQPNINSYQDLLDFLNNLNADWVKAMRRVSPQMLILLHELTGEPYYQYYAALDPFGKAGFSVAWAGESESKNWMHIAREYTEKFLHQQQIRDAVNKPGIMTEEFFGPFAEVCLLALPYTFREVPGEPGVTIKYEIIGEGGGEWYLIFNSEKWQLKKSVNNEIIVAEVAITVTDFWKLVSKSWRFEDAKDNIQLRGDLDLAKKAVSMVSFMA